MSAADESKKPAPTIAEINAYLEESAARTKKRLPLIGGGSAGAKPVSRPLPVVVTLPTTTGTAEDGAGKKKD